jgi:hypothetical protein
MARDVRWERRVGFRSEREFLEFRASLLEAVEDGDARTVEVDPNYGRAMIYGGEWFENPASGEVWRLVQPDSPFMGVWEPVLGYGPDSFKDVRKPAARPTTSSSRVDQRPVPAKRGPGVDL